MKIFIEVYKGIDRVPADIIAVVILTIIYFSGVIFVIYNFTKFFILIYQMNKLKRNK